jgi:hypothetical protein
MNNISHHIQNTWSILCEESDTREFGKFIAPIVERSIVPEWLDENGFTNSPAPTDNEGQQEKYDILTESGIRIQVKFRGGKASKNIMRKFPQFGPRPKLHTENTRRSTGKNADKGAANGQVRSGIHDSDVYLFVIPTGELWEVDKYHYLVIPTVELEDDKMKGYCCSSVSAKVMDKWFALDGVATLSDF